MGQGNLSCTVSTRAEGQQLYRQGIKHNLISIPAGSGHAQGDRVKITLIVNYAATAFDLPGVVVHSGSVATVVQLDPVPEAVLEALGVTEPAPKVMDLAEQTLVTSPMAGDMDGEAASDWSISDMDEDSEYVAPTMYGDSNDDESMDSESVESYREEISAEVETTPSGKHRKARSTATSTVSLVVPKAGDGPSRRKRPSYADHKRKKATTARGGSATSQGSPAGTKGIPVPGKPGQFVPGKPTEKGALDDQSMREVLMELLKGKVTGLLVVDGFRERYWAMLVQGRPVRYQRDPQSRSEAIDYLVIRAKLADAKAVAKAGVLAELTGRRVEDVIVSLGLVPRDKLDELCRKSARQTTERLMNVNYGGYAFYAMPEFADLLTEPPADVMGVLWERVREQFSSYTEKRIAELVDNYHKHHVVITDHGRSMVQELSVGGVEQRFLERYLRGGWQVSRLIGRLEMPTRKLVELLLSLEDLGIIQLSEDEGPNWRKARAERFLIDRMDYMERDYFAFVEAHWSCIESELMTACDKISKTLEEPIMQELGLAEVNQMRTDIRGKLAEVRTIFSTLESRRKYRMGMQDTDKVGASCDLFFKQGEIALFKKDVTVARECFQRIVELEPGGAGSEERLKRAHIVLRDLSKGVITSSTAVEDELDTGEWKKLSPEDLDRL